jgi:hypothetical protein
MKTWMVPAALAVAAWVCEAQEKTDGPAYTATVKIDDV